jgi:hypothetical protein
MTKEQYLQGMGCARCRPMPRNDKGQYYRPSSWQLYFQSVDASSLSPFFARLHFQWPGSTPAGTDVVPNAAAANININNNNNNNNNNNINNININNGTTATAASNAVAGTVSNVNNALSVDYVAPNVDGVTDQLMPSTPAVPPPIGERPRQLPNSIADERQRASVARAAADRQSLEETRQANAERDSVEAMGREMQRQQEQQEQQQHSQQSQQSQSLQPEQEQATSQQQWSNHGQWRPPAPLPYQQQPQQQPPDASQHMQLRTRYRVQPPTQQQHSQPPSQSTYNDWSSAPSSGVPGPSDRRFRGDGFSYQQQQQQATTPTTVSPRSLCISVGASSTRWWWWWYWWWSRESRSTTIR